jgi:pilus assembly protein CpaB
MSDPGAAPARQSGMSPIAAGVLGAILGAVVTLFLGGVVLGAVSYSAVKQAQVRAREGWNLVPVVVAAQDMPEGAVVTLDKISQRPVPEQFVTSSVVRPTEAAHIVNQKLRVPVLAGDPMLWTHFDTTMGSDGARGR